MRLIDPTILAQLAAAELKPFQLLEMVLDGGTYRYTDCDVPIGAQLRKETITAGPTSHGLCLAAGVAFVRLNGLDLSPYANSGFLLALIDGADKTATGYVSAADAAEALGAELLNNPNLTDWTGDNPDLWNIHDTEDANNYVTESAGKARIVSTDGAKVIGIYQVGSVTPGKLYKFSFNVTTYTGGTFSAWLRGPGGWGDPALAQSITSSGIKTFYATAESSHTSWTVMFYASSAGCDAIVDDFSLKEVTHAGTDGIHMVSAAGGPTRNWTSIESGFEYNDDEYIVTLSTGRFDPRGFKHDGARYSRGNIVDRVTLEIDNLDETLSAEFIGGDPQGSAVSLKEVVLDSDNQVIGNPVTWFAGTIDDYEVDEEKIRISVVGPNYAWSRRTTSRHPSSCRWRVFKGTECEYAGAESFCDRSHARCAALLNKDNFGGFRWLPSIENKEVIWGRKP